MPSKKTAAKKQPKKTPVTQSADSSMSREQVALFDKTSAMLAELWADEPQMLSLLAAAELVNMEARSIRKWRDRGLLEGVAMGSNMRAHQRITKRSLIAHLSRMTAGRSSVVCTGLVPAMEAGE